MCLIHDESLHYIYQNIMEAFDESKMLSLVFMRRVGAYLCTCIKEFYIDSKSIIKTQQSLYEWFDGLTKPDSENYDAKLAHFKPVIDTLRDNGRIDSGTKISFLKLLKDLHSFNYSKLRHGPKPPRRAFLMKQIHIKYDLKLCSFREFCDSLNNIDNCAIKYIEHIHDCKIYLRDKHDLSIRHFMGQVDATIEGTNMRDIQRAETAIKRLADSIHYRLMKKVPSAATIQATTDGYVINNFQILLQSPTASTADDDSVTPRFGVPKFNNLKDELFGNNNNSLKHNNNSKIDTYNGKYDSVDDKLCHKNIIAF